MLENYHTHTTRCRHATGTEEDYIRHAVANGLKVLGFSDHTPFLFPGTYYSSFRMFPHQIQDYAATILELKEKYRGQLDIHLGLEVEYYPDRMADLFQLIEPCGIEYMILGQHFCGNETDSPYNGTPTDDKSHLVRYCNQLIEAMETEIFTYIAHPDLLLFTGDSGFYRSQIKQLCNAAKEMHIPMEINLLGLRQQRHYPHESFWEIAGETGCPVVLGSDAHSAQTVIDRNAEAQALEIVKKYDLQLLEHIPLRPYSAGHLIK